MTRRYQEQIEVRLGRAEEHGVQLVGALPVSAVKGQGGPTQEVPTLFLWRGRVHLVRAVLSQWSQRVPWWRPDGMPAGEEDGPGSPGSSSSLEHRVWRVEAGAGRAAGTGVYDLVEGEQWWLERVSD